MNAPARILVVDDVEKNVRLLADILKFKGYGVLTAGGRYQVMRTWIGD